MSAIAWVVLGLVSGLVAERAVSGMSRSVVFKIVSGIAVASIAGALAYRFVEGVVVTPFQFWALCASMTGAVVLPAMHDSFMAQLPPRRHPRPAHNRTSVSP